MTPRRESANKHMLRAGTHKVLGRGRSAPVPVQVQRARVLIGRRAGADVSRSATQTQLR
jgi:hypothetical protein